jgi:hypothetical protein
MGGTMINTTSQFSLSCQGLSALQFSYWLNSQGQAG